MQNRLSDEDKRAILNLFETARTMIPSLPVSDALRNNELRQEILVRILGEALTDDERAALLGLPSGCRIREGAKIISPEKLQIGEYCWIGENAILDASGGLEIGSHCSIGLSVFVWSHSSHLTNLAMKNESGSNLIKRAKTTIGDGCFFAGPSVILPGVTIGKSVVVRPFSTVSKDIPDGSLVTGEKVTPNVFTAERIDRMISRANATAERDFE